MDIATLNVQAERTQAQVYMQLAENRSALGFQASAECAAQLALPQPEKTGEIDAAEPARLREVACELVDTGYKALGRVTIPTAAGPCGHWRE